MLDVKHGFQNFCGGSPRARLRIIIVILGMLTYMSMQQLLVDRAKEGRLRLMPAESTIIRPIFVTLDVWNELNDPTPDQTQAELASEMKAVVRYIEEGHPIVLGSCKHKGCQLKELKTKPPPVWEIRSRKPKPGMRLFGMFADVDVFIGTNLSNRIDLDNENSPAFKAAIRRCRTTWTNLFHTYTPHTGYPYANKETVQDDRKTR
jgi:hypothetical protein